MAGQFTLELDTKPLVARTKAIELGLSNRTILHERLVIYEQRRIFQNWGKGWPALAAITRLTRSGSAPLLDKGALRQSVTGTNPATVGTAPHTLNTVKPEVSVIGTNMIYGGVQNRGGEVRATRGKYITIPMSKEAKQDGSFPHHFHAGGKLLQMLRLKARPGFLVVEIPKRKGKSKSSAKTKAHWLLVESVMLPERRFMPTLAELTEDTKKVGLQWLDELYSGKLKPR